MSWKRSKITSSLMSLLGEHAPDSSVQNSMQDIRQAMLETMDDLSWSLQKSEIRMRVLYAPDIQALWYLRADLMTLLADPLGESAAKAQLLIITNMFTGLLPAAQKSRPNRLGR
jgi:hypothetical protein